MTDVVRRQQKPASAIRVFVFDEVNTCDAGEHQFCQ